MEVFEQIYPGSFLLLLITMSEETQHPPLLTIPPWHCRAKGALGSSTST